MGPSLNNWGASGWFQKISISPTRRELEIPKGWGGGQRPRKFWRDGGLFLSLENENSKEVRGLT